MHLVRESLLAQKSSRILIHHLVLHHLRFTLTFLTFLVVGKRLSHVYTIFDDS
jgi:hypothetical protein